MLMAVATVAVAAGVISPELLVLGLAIDAAALVLLTVDWLLARRHQVRAERLWPPMLALDTAAELTVRLHNDSPRRLRVHLREELAAAVADRPARISVDLPAESWTRWRMQLTPQQRGEHRVGALTARVTGPLGIALEQRRLLDGEPVRVYPRVRWGGKLGTLLVRAARRQLGTNPLSRRGLGGDFYALRPHLPGDGLRGVHWRASARHQKLMTRETTHEAGARVLILIDHSRAMLGYVDQLSKLDHSLAAALALARVAAGRGDRVTLLPFSDRPGAPVYFGSHGRQWSAAFERVFDLAAQRVEPNYDLAALQALETDPHGGTVVVITSLVDLSISRVLRQATAHLARRHCVLVINLEDPDLRRLVEAKPEDVEGVFARTSALGIQLGNRELTRRMRRWGVDTVTCPADRLALETVSRYLKRAA